MAETRTPRLGIPQWGAGTDSPSRADFNEAFLDLDNLAAIDIAGTLAARPAPSISGRYYYASDEEAVYRDTGTSWKAVGKTVSDQLVKASINSAIAQIVRGAATQSADLTQWQTSASAVLAKIDSAGRGHFVNLRAGTNPPTAVVGAAATATGDVVMIAKGFAGQTADLQRWENSAGTALARVDKDGNVIGASIRTTDGTVLENVEAYPFYTTGALSVATGKHELPLPANYTLVSVTARLGTAPTGASAIVDINYNGTTIFGTQANRPTFAAGSKVATVGAASVSSFVSGGYLSVDVDQVGSTVAGSDLVLLLRLRRTV